MDKVIWRVTEQTKLKPPQERPKATLRFVESMQCYQLSVGNTDGYYTNNIYLTKEQIKDLKEKL